MNAPWTPKAMASCEAGHDIFPILEGIGISECSKGWFLWSVTELQGWRYEDARPALWERKYEPSRGLFLYPHPFEARAAAEEWAAGIVERYR